MDLAIMIEGQNGLNWERWQRIARLADEAGFAGLYRSDHFTNSNPPDLDSLEAWVSLTWLASHTRRLDIGPLVSPFSFRHPAFIARMAAAVDDLSGGRLTLGLGAGWQDREHSLFGFDLLPVEERFARFEEGLEVVIRLLHSDQPAEFSGRFFQLQGASLLPRPRRPGGPPILVGGNGPRRTLPLAARCAAEWNGVYLGPDAFSRLSARLDALLEEQGRVPGSLRRSLMTGCFFGQDDPSLRRALGQRDPETLRQRGAVAGAPAQVIDQLGRLQEAGVQRVMLQWLDLDDLKGLEALARTVLPVFPG